MKQIPGEFVTDHFDRYLVTRAVECCSDPVLVHPWLKFAHPSFLNVEVKVNEAIVVR